MGLTYRQEDQADAQPASAPDPPQGWFPVRGLRGPPPPLIKPKTVPWDLDLSPTDFERLKAGFEPDDGDDRWILLAEEDPHPPGLDLTVKIIRIFSRVFWTFHLRRSASGAGGKVCALTWDQDLHGEDYSEEEAKSEAVKFARMMVNCDFDGLPR